MSAPVLAPAAAKAGPQCGSFVGTAGIRVTRLDGCGRPAFGAGKQSVATSSGTVSVEYEPEVEEGEDRSETNAAGEICVSDRAPDTLKWFNVTIEFCNVDPSLFQIMNPNWAIVRDAYGNATGFEIGEKFSTTYGFALETWPRYVSKTGSVCGDEGEVDDPLDPMVPTGYFLLPWALGVAPDSWTLENGVATFSLKARTKAPSPWKKGPYLVKRDQAGHPSPLLSEIEDGTGNSGIVDPVSGRINRDPRHFHADITTVGPPTPWCGARDLIRPQCAAPLTGKKADLTVSNMSDLVLKDANGDPQPGEDVLVAWGDGTPREKVPFPDGAVSHTYADSVTFPVKLRVEAPAGGFCEVEVKPTALSDSSGSEQGTRSGASTAGGASDSPKGKRAVAFTLTDPPAGTTTLSWGDGRSETTTRGGTFQHTYRSDGEYTITATDETGEIVATQRVTVPFETSDPHDGK